VDPLKQSLAQKAAVIAEITEEILKVKRGALAVEEHPRLTRRSGSTWSRLWRM